MWNTEWHFRNTCGRLAVSVICLAFTWTHTLQCTVMDKWNANAPPANERGKQTHAHAHLTLGVRGFVSCSHVTLRLFAVQLIAFSIGCTGSALMPSHRGFHVLLGERRGEHLPVPPLSKFHWTCSCNQCCTGSAQGLHTAALKNLKVQGSCEGPREHDGAHKPDKAVPFTMHSRYLIGVHMETVVRAKGKQCWTIWEPEQVC